MSFLELIKVINASSYTDLINFSGYELRQNFIEIVKYSRFINLISSLTILYALYNLIKLFYDNKSNIYLGILLFTCSAPFLISISHIRTELLSTGFIYLSLLYLFKIIKKDTLNRKYLILAGCFFTLSIFTKFQSIFIFGIIPFLFTIFPKKKNLIFFNTFENKKLHLISSLIFFLLILLIWLKYVKGLNYVLLPLSIIYFYILATYINIRFFNQKGFNIIFIFYFILGTGITFIPIISLRPFDTNNLNVIINLLGMSSMFIESSSPYSFSVDDILILLNKSSYGIYNYLKDILLFTKLNETILVVLMTIYTFINFKNIFILIEFFKFLLIIFIILTFFSVRPIINYSIFISPLIFIYFFSIFKNLKKNYLLIIIIPLIILNFTYQNNIFLKYRATLANIEADEICNGLLHGGLKHKDFFAMKRMKQDVFLKLCK